MPKAFSEWTVLEHGALEQLADNLWWAWGAVPGMSLRRTMVIARLRDGRLVIHNGIALDEPGMRALEALGTPAFLVVPNRGHRLDARAYKDRYPALRVIAPSGSRAGIEEVVPVDATYGDAPIDDDTVRFERLEGLADAEGAMLVRSPDGVTVVLNDVVMNMDRKRDVLGFLFTTILGSAPGPRVSRLSKLVYVKDRKALKASLERLAATPDLARLAVAHEKVSHGPDAAAALRRAATYL